MHSEAHHLIDGGPQPPAGHGGELAGHRQDDQLAGAQDGDLHHGRLPCVGQVDLACLAASCRFRRRGEVVGSCPAATQQRRLRLHMKVKKVVVSRVAACQITAQATLEVCVRRCRHEGDSAACYHAHPHLRSDTKDSSFVSRGHRDSRATQACAVSASLDHCAHPCSAGSASARGRRSAPPSGR